MTRCNVLLPALFLFTVAAHSSPAAANCPHGKPTRYRHATGAPRLDRAEPVTPGEVPIPKIESLTIGSVYTFGGNFFGSDQGFIMIEVHGVAVEAEILAWENNTLRFKVPNVGLAARAAARLDVILPDGRVVDSVYVWLDAGSRFTELPQDVIATPEPPVRGTGDSRPVEANPRGLRLSLNP